MIPEPGQRFGPYEIQSRLGGGGMGHVYRAWDARLHREVAIKLLNNEYAMPGMRERFLREARAASALTHPNICTIFDIGEQDGDPYLVMELLEGETLRDRIAERSLSVEEIVAIARETAEALGAAHSKGVIHRDVKPANIFLVEKPNGVRQSKVLDFGLAKIEGGVLGARQNRVSDLTTVGATVGTLAYMSPEQARGEVLDSRSDLFSLGVVMYEMATRHVPFQGATSALVFVQLLNHPPEPVREWNEAVPRELEKIIFKLLAKERNARFQTALELEQALSSVNSRPSGGWLRKAVSAVPLVRANDPIARGKPGMARSQTTPTHSAQTVQTITPPPQRSESPRPADDLLLRPVLRVPRADSMPPQGRTPAPEQRTNDTASPALLSPVTIQGGTDEGVPLPGSISDPGQQREQGPRRPGSEGRLRSLSTDDTPRPEQSADLCGKVEESTAEKEGQTPSRPEPGDQAAWSRSETGRSFPDILDPSSRRAPRKGRLASRWIKGLAILLALAALAFYLHRRAALDHSLLTMNDVVVVTEIENLTGNKDLDGSVAEALRISLGQSEWLNLRDGQSYRTATRLTLETRNEGVGKLSQGVARQAAKLAGAKAYLYGSMTGTSAPYRLHVDLRDVASDDVVASAEAHPESLQQVISAVDQVANDLRREVGEPQTAVERTSLPLAEQGTANITALRQYSEALTLIANRQPVEAVDILQQTVKVDPNFWQAYLQLSCQYESLRAEAASEQSAKLAFTASQKASGKAKLYAQANFELRTNGDYLEATALLRQLTVDHPREMAAQTLLANSLLLEGHYAEALQIAQRTVAIDPLNEEALHAEETALLDLDRFGAAFQLETQAEHRGTARPSDNLTAAFLDNRQDVVDEIASNIPVGRMEYRPDWAYGLYLDSTGHLSAGQSHWQGRAALANQNESTRSAAAYLLSQGSLDRAILGDCEASPNFQAAIDLQAVSGRNTIFQLGLASALCGDAKRANASVAALQRLYPHSFDVNGFYTADILGALAIREQRYGAALQDLQAAQPYDLISMTPYLRGLADMKRGESGMAIVDFQTILAHPGSYYLSGGDVYPASQIALARCFASAGDLTNSAAAYQRFLDMWHTADSGNGLVQEAKVHALS